MTHEPNALQWPENIVADRHPITQVWVLHYLTDAQAEQCAEVLRHPVQQAPACDGLREALEWINGLTPASDGVGVMYTIPLKPYTVIRTLLLQILTQPAASEPCPTCNGNDRDMPCAYPSDGKKGCLRDARLAASEPSAEGDVGKVTRDICQTLCVKYGDGGYGFDYVSVREIVTTALHAAELRGAKAGLEAAATYIESYEGEQKSIKLAKKYSHKERYGRGMAIREALTSEQVIKESKNRG